MQVVKCRLLQNSADLRSNFVYQQQSAREHASTSNRFAPTVALPSITAIANQPHPRPQRGGLGLQQDTMRTKLSAYRYFSDLDVQAQLQQLKTLQMQGKWADWDTISGGDLSWQKLLHGMTNSSISPPNTGFPNTSCSMAGPKG